MAHSGEDEDAESIEDALDEGEAATLDEDDPMNPAAWYGEPGVCGSCIAWRPEAPRPGEDVAAGACKLRPELGRVPATLTKCSIYKPRGQFVYQPGASSSTGRRRRTAQAKVLRRSAAGELVATVTPRPARSPAVSARPAEARPEPRPGSPAGPPDDTPRPPRPTRDVPREVDLGPDASAPAVRQALVELIRREHGRATRDIHSKFRTGGRAIAKSADGATVEISAERFFSFLDRYRSALDALEGAIERSVALADEREELTGQIRRMQGSFTTFNVLFADREDYFSGKE